jgi:predicted NodU family carbamoyl transferase
MRFLETAALYHDCAAALLRDGRIAAVTHIDFTTRVQTVQRGANSRH